VVLEHTGSYSLQWEWYLQAHGIGYCKVSSLHIKRCLGLTRGKTDRLDSRRIAQFGWRHREELTAQAAPNPNLERLRMLVSLRSKLVRDCSGYQCRLKEMAFTQSPDPSDALMILQRQVVCYLQTQIKALDQMIGALIQADAALQKTAMLMQSIKSIGPVITATLLAVTANFTRFTSARKFNCHAGLAPFAYQSGSSIRGRTRVSHLADKTLKTLLNLAASNAIQYNPELKQYYQKRVAEGKKPMAVLNIIRSKLVARIFAVIQRGTPYQPLPLAT
jgi:transposase